jgi:hypothetical protein
MHHSKLLLTILWLHQQSASFVICLTFPVVGHVDWFQYLLSHHFFSLFLCLVGVHCGIYKGSYSIANVSYLNPPLPWLSFVSPSTASWNCFSRYHFRNCIHVYTVFAPYSPSYPHFPMPPFPTGTNTPPLPPTHRRTYSTILLSDFVEEQQ